LYDATQQQRYIERQIRRWKREAGALDAAGQDNGHARMKVREWQARQRDFVGQTGLTRDYFRERGGAQLGLKTIVATKGIDGKPGKYSASQKQIDKLIATKLKNVRLTSHPVYNEKLPYPGMTHWNYGKGSAHDESKIVGVRLTETGRQIKPGNKELMDTMTRSYTKNLKPG
ncbi:MAG: phage minor capsid protein, partial [Clostridiales bacterium]|nr:phage minor capsid protein [Clostridiales bacterium]